MLLIYLTGNYSFAVGRNTTASGWSSVATGYNTRAIGNYSTVMGQYNVGTDINTMLEIGIGNSATKANALEVFNDGTLNVPSATNALIDARGVKAIPTVEWVQANSSSSTGLEAIDEGNGIGWRLIGRNAPNYGNIGTSAIDLSISRAASTIRGSTGYFSFSTGYGTTSSGVASTALGYQTIASGDYSVAIGYKATASFNSCVAIGDMCTASGEYSTALGKFTNSSASASFAIGRATNATGNYSVAMGYNTTSPGIASVAMGKFNVGTDINTMLEIGIGTASTSKANALEVFNDGTLNAPGATITNIDARGVKAIPTVEWVQANSSASSGLEAIDEGNGIGWRLVGANTVNYGNIGLNAVDLSICTIASTTYGATGNYSFVIGSNNTASGNLSTAMGSHTSASGHYSTAIGRNTIASGSYSTAMGNNTSASGSYSTASGYRTTASSSACTAMGNNTSASGSYSTAMGNYTSASGSYSTAIGTYNVGTDVNTILEIGIGTSTAKANALEVFKDGTINAPSATNTLIDTRGVKGIPTVEWVQDYLVKNQYVPLSNTIHNENTVVSTDTFFMNFPIDNKCLVMIDGIIQHENTYTYVGSRLTMSIPLLNNQVLSVFRGNTYDIHSETATSISGYIITPTFTIGDEIALFIDGMLQDPSIYTLTTTTIIINIALNNNEIRILNSSFSYMYRANSTSLILSGLDKVIDTNFIINEDTVLFLDGIYTDKTNYFPKKTCCKI